MQMSELRSVLTAQPFLPFEIVMGDAFRIEIRHPETVAIPPFDNAEDRRVVVMDEECTRTLDVFHILRLEQAIESAE